jgi:hypothetical protein
MKSLALPLRRKTGGGKSEVAETLGKYSQLDVLLPSQQYNALRKLTPEQRLMVAVLDDVLDCLEKYRRAVDSEGCRLFDEARQWLLAEETDWLYSFQGICSALDLNSSAVLRNLCVEPERNEPARE